MFSTNKKLNFGQNLNTYQEPVFGRYYSSFLSSSITSTPGAALLAARVYGTFSPYYWFGKVNGPFAGYGPLPTSPFLFSILSLVQERIIGTDYPYAGNFFDPNY